MRPIVYAFFAMFILGALANVQSWDRPFGFYWISRSSKVMFTSMPDLKTQLLRAPLPTEVNHGKTLGHRSTFFFLSETKRGGRAGTTLTLRSVDYLSQNESLAIVLSQNYDPKKERYFPCWNTHRSAVKNHLFVAKFDAMAGTLSLITNVLGNNGLDGSLAPVVEIARNLSDVSTVNWGETSDNDVPGHYPYLMFLGTFGKQPTVQPGIGLYEYPGLTIHPLPWLKELPNAKFVRPFNSFLVDATRRLAWREIYVPYDPSHDLKEFRLPLPAQWISKFDLNSIQPLGSDFTGIYVWARALTGNKAGYITVFGYSNTTIYASPLFNLEPLFAHLVSYPREE